MTACSVALLTSCFTGIESTPKISAEDLKEVEVLETPEQRFVAEIGSLSLSQWASGKRFIVTDDKVALIFGSSAIGVDSLKGEVLTYKGAESAINLAGGQSTTLSFATEKGDNLFYKIDNSFEQLSKRSTVDIPFAIDLDLVNEYKRHLKGKTIYVLSSAWYDSAGNKLVGKKYIPVTIVDVLPGNSIYPLYVVFDEENDKRGGVYLTHSSSLRGSRNFDALFSFTDPKMKYPNIAPENWEKIKNGQLAIGMTRDECRLAIGSPADIVRIPGYSGLKERWAYSDGVYLLFEDGLLTEFR